MSSLPPHRRDRKVRSPFLLKAPSAFSKSKDCLLALVLTGVLVKSFITLMGNSEVQVQCKSGKMKIEEVLQTDQLAEQCHRHVSGEKG